MEVRIMVFRGTSKKANIVWKVVKVIVMLIIIASAIRLVSGKVKAESISGTATVTADSLNVRSGPGKDNDAIGKVKKGDVVQATEIEGDWVKITFGDKEGYVASEYVELEIDEEEIEDVEDVSEDAGLSQEAIEDGDEETTEDVSDYKVIFILIGIIVVVMIIILITIKSIKDMDDDYDDDDDYYDDEEDEYDEDEYEEDDDVEYDDDDDVDYEDDEDDDEEYEEIIIRRPKKSTGKKAKSSDDYSINIDPRYFD